MSLSAEEIAMVEEFQCPGCVCGSDTKCGTFQENTFCCPICRDEPTNAGPCGLCAAWMPHKLGVSAP